MESHKVLIIGSGGRENALAWKISQSRFCEKLFIAPGNAGTSFLGQNVEISVLDFIAIKDLILSKKISIVIIGPEDPLVNGLHDFLINHIKTENLIVIGPKKNGAILEGSKKFAKEFMFKHKIPTARYRIFNKKNIHEANAFLNTLKSPYVLKADGLAAGKGVLILTDLNEAKKSLENMILKKKFGQASERVVIEEYLNGIEVSSFVLTNGDSYKIFPMAKDYKRIGAGDTGLNTGGMGAISPVPFVDKKLFHKIENQIIRPTINGLKKDKIDYLGFLFIGLMIVENEPYVIEYNVRLGDPETEAILPRIESDLLQIFLQLKSSQLQTANLKVSDLFSSTVMTVSKGYPEKYEKGKIISGLDSKNDSFLFHSGTKKEGQNIVTSGGRVIAVTSMDKLLDKALEKSYKTISKIEFEGKTFRNDIGFDL
tara:strand:- start:4729 stop:6009 length:1281 start_codon:yes stop_codon:yes gene_type:complete